MERNRVSAIEDIIKEFALAFLLLSLSPVGFSATDPNDLVILRQFENGLLNSELLKWPENDNDPCGNKWPHIFCAGTRVSQIQVQNLGLNGPLPENLNQLPRLSNLGLQMNKFSGTLPLFSGLSELRYLYLDYNNFTVVPADFFSGLDSLEILALDGNNFNGSTGWMFPSQLKNSAQLTNLTCMSCNLVGPLPDFLGSMSSLTVLLLSGNRISGGIPASYSGMVLKMLWLNNQGDGGMTGSIEVVTSMASLTSLWLHGNKFSGVIPESIGNLSLLQDLNLNGNDFVGLIPESLVNMKLNHLDLNNNHFMGPVPIFKTSNASFPANSFCQSNPGASCAPEVMALIEFLGGLNYPLRFVSSWSGNDPCQNWLGLNCDSARKVSRINLPNFNLSGTLSPSVGNLNSLNQIVLHTNKLSGRIPTNWTSLKSLTLLDLSQNNISLPLPSFSSSVKLLVSENPLIDNNSSLPAPSPGQGGAESPSDSQSSSSPTGTSSNSADSNRESTEPRRSVKSILLSIVLPVVCIAVFVFLIIFLFIYCCYKKKNPNIPAPGSLVIHPRDPSEIDNYVKIAIASDANGSTSHLSGSGAGSGSRSRSVGESHVIDLGNLVISVQVLRNVTKNFAQENELGRGGFGAVYKGELDDGTKIAVKRMESGVIGSKGLDEFQAEIAVLSKVRHRHLVSLLGYSIEGHERILVYEYMPQGALSKHLFHWKSLKLEPLSWKRRLNIALDVARGMEYLHTLAHQSFIHRDLKPSNILLGDDFRAKVSDFGLVKLAPNGEKSVVTRLAGTFGYLAPEYAVTGKITTKADVFSFGVVLVELLTGMMALDEDRPEESQYLAAWFWQIKSDKEKLMAAVDPAIDFKEDTSEIIWRIAELAGHCTTREPNQRPDMGHVVNVLSPLVEKWKPFDDEMEGYSGIDYSLPLDQMVKVWQESEDKDFSYVDLLDSKGSIPPRPTGLAESFTSSDGR